jgi:NAD(P)-dependent dehydrogenase (short-subunit alcohol dehydrogenase family)
MRLEGKIAFVTGADSGIGRATALTFAREGADVAIHVYGDERGAAQTLDAIRAHGRRGEMFEADFTDLGSAGSTCSSTTPVCRRGSPPRSTWRRIRSAG